MKQLYYKPGEWSDEETKNMFSDMRNIMQEKGKLDGKELLPSLQVTSAHFCISRILNEPPREFKRKFMPLSLMKLVSQNPTNPLLYGLKIPYSFQSDKRMTRVVYKKRKVEKDQTLHANFRTGTSGHVLFKASRKEKEKPDRSLRPESVRPLLEKDPSTYDQRSCIEELTVNQTRSIRYIIKKGRGYNQNSLLPPELCTLNHSNCSNTNMTVGEFATNYVYQENLRRYERKIRQRQHKKPRLV